MIEGFSDSPLRRKTPEDTLLHQRHHTRGVKLRHGTKRLHHLRRLREVLPRSLRLKRRNWYFEFKPAIREDAQLACDLKGLGSSLAKLASSRCLSERGPLAHPRQEHKQNCSHVQPACLPHPQELAELSSDGAEASKAPVDPKFGLISLLGASWRKAIMEHRFLSLHKRPGCV